MAAYREAAEASQAEEKTVDPRGRGMEATTAVQTEMEQMVTSMVVWSEALQAKVMAAMLAPGIEAVATAKRGEATVAVAATAASRAACKADHPG